MVFSKNQIQDMISIMKRWQYIFIAEQIGLNFLTPAEIAVLKAAGIDINLYKNKKGVIEHAFLWGLLAEAIGDDRAKKMDYNQFQKFLASGNFVPLTEEEEFALEQVKNRAYNDITGLGNRIASGLSNQIIRANLQQQIAIKRIIKEKTIKAVELRYGARQLAAELGEATKDWERDWLRIAYYLTHEAFNTGRAQSIFKNYGEDAEVYFDVLEGACKICNELYLEDPDNPFSKPKVFLLKDILANGNNIGRKRDEMLPTVSPVHPYCRCTINHKKPGFDWDDELRGFVKPIKIVSKNPKLQGVKLNIKISK
jgi:hypothetical protein